MHRIIARRARDASVPRVDRDPAIVSSFLSDAAHVAGGSAAGVAFPRNEAEVAALVRDAERVLPIGAQSSLTGGATPRGEIVLSTRALSSIFTVTDDTIRVGSGVPLTTLQATLTGSHFYYPPVPTFEGAFVGGVISTNAAGAATFKYGSTRPWVAGITVALSNGDVLDIARGEVIASTEGVFEVELTSGHTISIAVPKYRMPNVAKLSAGYYAKPAMDLIDLFIGSEGTLGVIVEATLRVIQRPRRAVALIRCEDDEQAVAVTTALRGESLARRSAEREGGAVSAIEYMDGRALRVVPDEVFVRAGVTRPGGTSVLLMAQIEIESDEGATFERLQEILDSCGVRDEATVAAPDDERGAQRLFELREAVPASVNALVAAAKRTHADIEKTAGDMVVPFSRLAESIGLYRQAFESRGLDYAIWGHVSDGNLHPNLIPRTLDEMKRGREAIFEIARGVIGMDGAPLAEHGVGRSALKQRLLRELYGDEGIEQMRAVKRALDPEWKLAPGVLFPA